MRPWVGIASLTGRPRYTAHLDSRKSGFGGLHAGRLVEDDYFIVFAESDIHAATARYGLSEFLPQHQIVGIVGWDDFLVRDPSGRTLRIPTVPIDPQYSELFDSAEHPPRLESDARFTGRIKWYVQPLIFGGAPEDESNITWVSHEIHAQLVVWWNQQYRRLKP